MGFLHVGEFACVGKMSHRIKGARVGLNCMYTRYLDLKRYEFAARAIDEIGRLIGGWFKAQRGAAIPVAAGSVS